MKREILIRKVVKAAEKRDEHRLAALARLYMFHLGKKDLEKIDQEVKRRVKNG
jgi:hypothetical protein